MKNLRSVLPKERCGSCRYFEAVWFCDWVCNVDGDDKPLDIENPKLFVCDCYKPRIIVGE